MTRALVTWLSVLDQLNPEGMAAVENEGTVKSSLISTRRQNANDESCNGKFRDEYLSYWLRNRVDAKVGIEQRRRHGDSPALLMLVRRNPAG